MQVDQDVHTVDDLSQNTKALIQKARRSRRPMVITMDGKPAAILLSTDLFPSKRIALEAACELVLR
ncbi:MAG: type II toxin-antitoxin system prevent-host-death family antitoxin [Phycisphaerae bacterium]